MKIEFTSAICTPLDDQENLDVAGFEKHVAAQWDNDASGILFGGTMGLMQLLKESTYLDLVTRGANLSQGKGEILVGVGDTSYSRTLQKIESVSSLPIDGVVVVTPWFFPFSEQEICDYFRALAKASRHPLYIYYLPKLTKVELSVETILKLAQEPNIKGIKSSTTTDWTMQLFERVPPSFRVIVSAPLDTCRLARMGVTEFLDGVNAVFPRLSKRFLAALRKEDWDEAQECEQVFTRCLDLLRAQYPLFGAVSAILNSQGIAGRCNVSPLTALQPRVAEELLAKPEVQLAIAGRLERDKVAA